MSIMSTGRTESIAPIQFRLRTLLFHLSLLSFALAILARGGPTIVVALLFPFFWTWGWIRIALGTCSYCVMAASRLIDFLERNQSP